MNSLEQQIATAESDLASIEVLMQTNADRYARLCDRYLEVSKLLRELRAMVATEIAQG